MRNLKFGVFCLGLIVAIATVVSSLSAQTRVMALDGRGSQLGVMVSDVDAKATTGGVTIDEVTDGSPAEKAGIKAGDVVVDYDGERVRSARQFTRLIQETPGGRTVAIGVWRDGKKQTLNATPENSAMTFNVGPEVDRAMREAERGMREFRFDMPKTFDFRFDGPDRDTREPRRFEHKMPGGVTPFIAGSRGRLGVSVQSLTPDLEEYFGATNGGALVSSVTKDSAAARAGIKAGDVIVSINGKRVSDSDDLVGQMDDVTGNVTIVVLRDKKETTINAKLDEPKGSSPQVVRPQVVRPGSRPGV
jgi:S1-C subfamily serine protease